jgi:NAD(P)-dependent dehydrogenase (short-subunit alcohol dehydrogenase family)
MAVNVKGTFIVTQEFMQHVLALPEQRNVHSKPSLSIVNIGSGASTKGYASFGAYVASKHAVLGLTRTWALDFAPFGVRVNIIAPGPINTPLMAAQLKDPGARGEAARQSTNNIPLRRFGETDEIAAGVLFLLGSSSSYVTGQLLAIDGGF